MGHKVVWLDQDPSNASTPVSELPSEADLGDPRLRLLLLDDDPKPLVLLRKLALPGTVLFVARKAVTAYAALFTRPFTYDAVFVDWRMDEWEHLSDEFIASIGIPDTIPSGGLFLRVLSSDRELLDTEAAVQGGHSELLVSLASTQGALTILHSIFIDRKNEEEVYRLRARGAHYFLPKIPSASRLEEVRHLLLSIAGNQRDRRLWRAIPLTTLRSILEYLTNAKPEDIQTLLTEFDGDGIQARHQRVLSLNEQNYVEYLVGSLTWLRQQRFYCAERLFADAMKARAEGRDDAERLERMAAILQPTLPPIVLSPNSGSNDDVLGFISQIQEAHRTHQLESGQEFLHIVVASNLGRIDYYSAIRAKSRPLSETSIEHLGTTFGPRLTAAIDQNGVWPALKLSKLRHLLRSKRNSRIVHQGSVAVRCAEKVFGPSIDSLLLGHLLLRLTSGTSAPLSRVQYAAEIGIGTGYLLCMLSAFSKNRIQLLIGSDISSRAVEVAESNLSTLWAKRRNPPLINLALCPDALTSVRANYLDLVISNPPYLPEPALDNDGRRARRKTRSAIAGEEVIRHILVKEGPRVLKEDGIILMVTSTLTRTMLQIAEAEAEAAGINWKSRELTTMSFVPLDLPEVQQDPKWVEMLLEEEAKHVIFDADSPDYPLRHGIVVTAYSRDSERIAELSQYLGVPN